jgi:hypothetical protein
MDGNFSQQSSAREGFVIRVLDQDLEPRDIAVNDERVLGRQIAHEAGQIPVDNAIVLRRRPGHPLASVPLDELVELHHGHPDEFVVGSGDRTFLLFLNGERNDWAWSTISANVLLKLAGLGSDHEVLLERTEVADEVLVANQVVDLNGVGIERFITRPSCEVTVTFNLKPFTIRAGTYTTEQLRVIFQVEPGYALDVVPTTGDFWTLKPGESIKVTAGLAFASVAPGGQSS